MELNESTIIALVIVVSVLSVSILAMQIKIWLRLEKVSKDLEHLAVRIDVVERFLFRSAKPMTMYRDE